MRIAQIVSAYHPHIGGVETHVQHLAHGCVQAGDQVTVYTHQIDESPADEWMDGVHVLRFPLTVRARNYPASLALFRCLKKDTAEFDLVHAHSYHTLMGHAAIRTRLPFVFTPHYHGTGHSSFRAILHDVYRSVGTRQFTAADVIICNSDAEKRLLVKDFPWVSGKLMTIHPGTNPVQATPGKTFELVNPTILVVGRLERYKNVDLVIDAFRRLPLPASLVVVGQGPDRERLERRAEDCDPKRPVLFTGRISDELLQELYTQASVVVAASDHEAFGLSVAEGLAAGARVLASAIPAHAEIAEKLGPDAAITLIDVRDSRGFVRHLEEVLLAGLVTHASFKLPTWSDFVTDVRGVYAQVLASQRSLVDGNM